MKHGGKARQEGTRLLLRSAAAVLLVIAGGLAATLVGSIITMLAASILVAWAIFALFCLNFFRDPDPRVPQDPAAIVSPAHGKVDVIEETAEPEFMGGACRRVSVFLSIFDVHVQNMPAAGTVACFKHSPGQFLNAMNKESSRLNENLLIGLESSEAPGERIGVRLIAGLIARRILPWVALHDVVERGERCSLIRFGSRVDLYLPLTARVCVKLGDRVKGGETVVATRSPTGGPESKTTKK